MRTSAPFVALVFTVATLGVSQLRADDCVDLSVPADESCRHSWFDDLCGTTSCLNDIPFDCGCSEGGTLSFGGELRHRFHHEADRLRPGGPGTADYDLWRWRNWLDYRTDDFGVHVEMLDASQFGEDPMPPTAIDVNRWDLYGAYVDVNLFDYGGLPVVLRYGRQDLLSGAQRLVSPLDFANTRRNFEGLRLFHHGESWDIDAFATRPVNPGTNNGPPSRFDSEGDRANQSRTFSGVYATYHGREINTFDMYWLWLREQDEFFQPAGFADGSRHTVGLRWAGSRPVTDECGEAARVWSWDIEGGYQFGHDEVDETVNAGFLTGIAGHQWTAVPWQPKLSALCYWGSGDDDPNDDENNTFSVLFPLGHAYWGLIDNLSGQNLQDYSVQVALSPTEKLSLLGAVHWFDLASDGDVLYNVAGTPMGVPGTGREVGEEFDLVANYQFSECLDVQVLYSWFFYGTFVENNLHRDDASLFYVQTTYRY